MVDEWGEERRKEERGRGKGNEAKSNGRELGWDGSVCGWLRPKLCVLVTQLTATISVLPLSVAGGWTGRTGAG